MSEPHGLLVVDKPRGPTSHTVVAQARRLFGTRAVGHAGTLDPMASGVLLLVFGEATKLAGYLANESKRYRALVQLGIGTDSLDLDGRVLERCELPPQGLPDDALARALDQERARTEQQPPAMSAIHVAGQRAYALARRGAPPELTPRPVRVLALELLTKTADQVTVELSVTKGYYVRSFARDLGAALGVPACLAGLRRLASGVFDLDQAEPWPPQAVPPLVPVAAVARTRFPAAELTDAGVTRARHGQPLLAEHFVHLPDAAPDAPAAWFAPSGDLIALGAERDGGWVVLRGFNDS